jgi:ssDNA-binding Zn-finger/Zn-ribbon topoisomerase 1
MDHINVNDANEVELGEPNAPLMPDQPQCPKCGSKTVVCRVTRPGREFLCRRCGEEWAKQ